MENHFEWLTKTYSVWCACEYTTMRMIRQLSDQHLSIDKQHCYFSSYWKRGMTEDGHKIIKQKDAIQRT